MSQRKCTYGPQYISEQTVHRRKRMMSYILSGKRVKNIVDTREVQRLTRESASMVNIRATIISKYMIQEKNASLFQ